jgi:peptide/nickel transport system substrate-binding protein
MVMRPGRFRLASVAIVALLAAGLARATLAGAAPDVKQTLVVAVSRDMQNLDPTNASSDSFTLETLTNVYSWLIDYKVVKQPNGQTIGAANEFVGNLAESFRLTDGGKKLLVTLRRNLKFSNGDPVDANAVKFTYDRLFDQNATTAALTKMAEVRTKDAVRVVDDRTVEFGISEPNTLLLGNMSQYGHSILNPNVVRPHMTAADPSGHEWLKSNTKGTETGPYVLESWQPGVEFVLTRNPNFWGPPPRIARVVLRIVPDPSARLALLRSGDADIARDLAPLDEVQLLKDPNVTVYRFPTRIVSFLGMNASVAPFNNVKLRQAISYAIPYGTIIRSVMVGFARPLTSPVPSGMPTHTDEFFKYKTDPARAKALLAEAGFPSGTNLTFTSRADLAESKSISVWVKSALARTGVNVTINEMPGAAFTAALQKHELVFFHHPGWNSINNDPFYHVFWLLKSSCCDYTNYHNKEIDDLITKYTVSTDLKARADASRRIQEIATDEAAWVFLYQPDLVLTTRKNVGGVVYYPADVRLRYYYLTKE